MNNRLIVVAISVCVAFFNLYCYIQRYDLTSLILFIIWSLVAVKYFRDYHKDKKDKNSKNNA